jgi:hypothetical protein
MDYNRRPRQNYQYDKFQRNRIERTNRNVNRYFEANFVDRRPRRDNRNYDFVDRRQRRDYNNYLPNRRRNNQFQQRRQEPRRQFNRGLRLGTRTNVELRGIRNEQVLRRGNRRGNRNEVRGRFRNERREERIFGRRNLPIGKIIVSNLPAEAINDDLITIFGAYGRLKRCAVIFENNESTRTGVVQYFSKACTERALHDLNGTLVKGSNIHLELEDTRRKNNKQGQNVAAPQQQGDYVMSGQ